MSNVIASVLGYVPIIGNISSLVLDIRGIVNQFAITNIRNAGGYAKIVNTYSREWGTKASLVTGWSDRYYIKVPSSAQGISFKGF